MSQTYVVREPRQPVRAPAWSNQAGSQSPPHGQQRLVQPVSSGDLPRSRDQDIRTAVGPSAADPTGGRHPPMAARPPRLLDRVRNAIRTRHYSYRTEGCLPKP